jgi:adenylylsulfate kinase
MRETHKRSLIKTVSWRVIATLTTASLVFIFTGSFTVAVEIGALEVILKLLFYYLHERTWGKIRWGKYLPPNPPTPSL